MLYICKNERDEIKKKKRKENNHKANWDNEQCLHKHSQEFLVLFGFWILLYMMTGLDFWYQNNFLRFVDNHSKTED